MSQRELYERYPIIKSMFSQWIGQGLQLQYCSVEVGFISVPVALHQYMGDTRAVSSSHKDMFAVIVSIHGIGFRNRFSLSTPSIYSPDYIQVACSTSSVRSTNPCSRNSIPKTMVRWKNVYSIYVKLSLKNRIFFFLFVVAIVLYKK